MQKNLSKTRMMALGSMLLAVTGCVTSPPIIAEKAPCSTLIPDSMRDDVEGAPAPAKVNRNDFQPTVNGQLDFVKELARGWTAMAVAQTGQLQKANDEKRAGQEIVMRCEQRDAAAIKRARPKFLGIF